MDTAFTERETLKAVVLNDGLEKLGECRNKDYNFRSGAISCTYIRHITLPSTLQVLGDGTFCMCWRLRRVTFQEGSQLEKIGQYCFYESRIEKIEIPKTLKMLAKGALENCKNLRVVSVEDGCRADLMPIKDCCAHCMGPPLETVVCGEPLQGLRRLRKLVIPDGLERIGNHWFWNTDIEHVVIPSSVREIGAEAFCHCLGLKRLVFGGATTANNKDENLPSAALASKTSHLGENQLKTIDMGAFLQCSNLKSV